MNEHIDEALNELRRAERANNPDSASHALKAAHVRAMLAVAAEIADLHQTIGRYLEAAANPPAFIDHHEAERTCRICGCTDDHACEDGCWWADLDEFNKRGGPLCSRCVEPADKQYTADLPKAEGRKS